MRRQAVVLLTTAMTTALVAVLLVSGLASAQVTGTTFRVTSTGDAGDPNNVPDGTCDSDTTVAVVCTLREAIFEANNNGNSDEQDVIAFNISGDGPHTISPSSTPLPQITQAVNINGYSQGEQTSVATDNAVANTNTQGSINAVLRIRLDGQSLDAATGVESFLKDGLSINAPNVMVQGLSITRFTNSGIEIGGAARNARIEGNFVGTDPVGTEDFGNRGTGVQIGPSSGGQVGNATTPAGRNLISGNGLNGISFSNTNSSSSRGYKVEGNLVGTQKDGTSDLPNTFNGVGIFNASNNFIGGNSAAAENVIRGNNCGSGVIVTGNGSVGNSILRNSIFENGCRKDDPGIDLVGDRTTVPPQEDPETAANIIDPKDKDLGPNRLQNAPQLSTPVTSGGSTTITGTLKSTPRKQFTIRFFASPEADQSGFGEGKTFLGQVTKRTNDKGKASYTSPPVTLPTGENIVAATATNNATGDTSEFSNAVTAG